MVKLDIIKSNCIKYNYLRHKNFPHKFLSEWKSDNIIFDLVSGAYNPITNFWTN